MDLIVRQPQEGFRFITAQVANDPEDCIASGGSYVSNSISVVIDGVAYPIPTATSFGFGRMTFPVPSGVVLRAGITVQIISNCSPDVSPVTTVLPIGLTISAEDAFTCNNTSPVVASFQDRFRVFSNVIADSDPFMHLEHNGSPLNSSAFFVQSGYTNPIPSSGGDWRIDVAGDTSMFSNALYPPTNSLVVTVLRTGVYFLVGIGYIDVIFHGSGVNYIDYLAGTGEVDPGISYIVGDTFTITSTVGGYEIRKNADAPFFVKTKNVEYTLPPGGGSISPNPTVAGNVSIWTLPTAPGNRTVGVKIGDGIETSTIVNVAPCDLTADNKSAGPFPTNSTGNVIPTLTGTAPTNCSVDRFKITNLPNACATLRVGGVAVTLNQEITPAQAATLTIDVGPSCTNAGLDFTYQAVSDEAGCQDSANATVSIAVSDVTATANNDSWRGQEGVAIVINTAANDVPCSAGNTYYEVITGSATNGSASINQSTGVANFTPSPSNYRGAAMFRYNLRCGPNFGSSVIVDTADVNIFIYGATANDDTYSVPINTAVSGSVSSNDTITCDSTVGFSVVGGSIANGSLLSFDSSNGEFEWEPNNNFVGNGGFQYYITCGGVQISNIATVTITTMDDCNVCDLLEAILTRLTQIEAKIEKTEDVSEETLCILKDLKKRGFF